MKIQSLILAIGLFQFLLVPLESKEPPSREKILHHLVKVMVDPEMVAAMKKDFYEKIKMGLNMSNRKIFEELLAEAKSSRRQEMISKYDALEKESNALLKRVFGSKVDLLKIVRAMNKFVYSKHFSDEELMGLYRFYSSPLGKKYVKVSRQMLIETQEETAKSLLPLSMEVSGEVQEQFHRKVIGLFEEDLEIEP